MNRRLTTLAVLSLLVAGTALATDTGLWSKPVANASKVTYPTGTGVAPTDLQPDGGRITDLGVSGLSLNGLRGFVVTVEALSDAGVMSAGSLKCYIFSQLTNSWTPAPDLDLTVAAGRTQSFAGFTVTANVNRIAYVPSVLATAVNVYVAGSP